MSRFLLLNFEDFGLNQDITKTIQPNTPVCICCLDKKSPFINLLTCAHSDYLNYFTKPLELKPHNQVVCYECHAILIKIKQFKKQVEDSFKILMGETKDTQPVRKKTKVLTYHKAVDVLLAKKFTNRPKVKNIVCSETVTINKDINMKNIQTGLDIINKNNQNACMISVLAQGLQTLNAIGIDSLGLKHNATTLKDIQCNKEDNVETEIPLIKEELEEEMSNECKELGNLSTIKEENEFDTELTISPDIALSQTSDENEKVRKVTITNEELVKERSLLAESKIYTNLLYKCENCLIGFKFEENYEDHVKRKHKHQNGSIKCEVCRQELSSTDSHNNHTLRHYTRYECLSCNERFYEYNDAVFHYKKEHTVNGTKYTCHHCNFTTDVLNKLKLHSLKHHKMLTCKICGKTCSNSARLTIHVANAHKKEKKHNYKCKKCPQSFSTKLELQKHVDILHIIRKYYNVKYKSFVCPFCHRIFKFKGNLDKHLQMHSKKSKKAHITDK